MGQTIVWWRRGSVMDCCVTTRVSIPGGYSVKNELHIFHKGQKMGVPSLNYLAVNGKLNTTNQLYINNILSHNYVSQSYFEIVKKNFYPTQLPFQCVTTKCSGDV